MVLSQNKVSAIQNSILRTVLYFDVFNYPLTKKEIFENIDFKTTVFDCDKELDELVNNGLIGMKDDFYFNRSLDPKFITKRVLANNLSKYILPKAFECSRRISKFPFVRGICISGGLSKNYYDKNSDIDYFVITKANRLWLCRTLFTLFYKTLSKKNKEFYCLNYFISEADLVIPDRNQFVATELVYLLPTINHDLYLSVLEANSWYLKSFPNKTLYSKDSCATLPNSRVKSGIEFLFTGAFGDWCDTYFLKITVKHWRRKFVEMSTEDFELQIRSKKHVCKHHTKGYQNKVLQNFHHKMVEFEKETDVSLK